MEFKNGTSVYTGDGKHAGNLSRVVIHPETKEITHVVVGQGILADQDRVVPMEFILNATRDLVALSCSSEVLKNLSPLIIKQLELRDQGEHLENLGGGIYTNTSLDPYVVKEIIRTVPEELVALKEGARVMSEDGKHVGNVEIVLAEDGKVAQFITEKGLLFKTQRAIPITWVQMMSDDEVKLTVSARMFEELSKE